MKFGRQNVLFLWLVFLFFCVLLFIFDPQVLRDVFTYLSTKSLTYIYVLILVLGMIRSFTLIPVTNLILLGLIFIPATPLYFIIMFGIMVSSTLVYFFFEYLQVDKLMEKKYKKQIETTKHYLKKYQFPVIILWAMSPILPSDIICYVSGTLRINFYKFFLAMLIGEGSACAVYIFGGKYFLQLVFGINL